MKIFKKDPKERNYVGGEKHWAEVIENVGNARSLVFLHPDKDFNINSTLIVHPGEIALFEKNGRFYQKFEEGRHLLKTENYPIISRLRNIATGGVSTFNCRIFYVKTASSVEIKWGVRGPIQMRDKVLGIQTDVYVRGAYKVSISEPEKFIFKLMGSGNIGSFTPEDLDNFFSNEFHESIKTNIATTLNNLEGEILGIASRQEEISNTVSKPIERKFSEYGIKLLKFSVSDLEIDDNELRRRYDEIGMDVIEKIKNAKADKAVMDILGEDWKSQQTVDILKAMAQNQGTANVGAGIGAGIAAGTSLWGLGQQLFDNMPAKEIVPPPINILYAFINGEQVGPLTIQQVKQLIDKGSIKSDTLIWKKGMAEWKLAICLPELQQLLSKDENIPPIPPTPSVNK